MASDLAIGFISIIICLIISYLIAPMVKIIGTNFNIIDFPDSRKVHSIPIVRIGGLSIFLSFFLFQILIYFINKESSILFYSFSKIPILILGSIFYFFIGFHDDIFRSSPFFRLLAGFLISFVISIAGINFSNVIISFPFLEGQYNVPLILIHIITAFWIVGITNAINWLDGMDGLASGYSGIIFLGLFYQTFINQNLEGIILFASLAGATIGFLIRNLKPAFYIMGDCGSYFLGFWLSTGALLYSTNNSNSGVPILYLLILFSLPILDMIFVIISRIYKGLNPFRPDANHLHHRLIRLNLNYTNIIFLVYFYAVISVFAATLIVSRI
tara:strand:- start:95 stop:1078 length:984 start_codon:yes stop_codon:yes gene_type:complete